MFDPLDDLKKYICHICLKWFSKLEITFTYINLNALLFVLIAFKIELKCAWTTLLEYFIPFGI